MTTYRIGYLTTKYGPQILKRLALGLLASIFLFGACHGYSQLTSKYTSNTLSLTSAKNSAAQLPFKTSRANHLQQINPHVLALARKAQSKAQTMGVMRKSLMTIIDYSLPSTQPRLWVVDLAKGSVVYHTHVAHGSGSGGNQSQQFSDRPGSNQSSLGVFVTGKTYQGKHGTSLVLHGLEQGINGNAERRRIVIHGANYVNTDIIKSMGRLGRSWGCPALNSQIAQPVIQTIKEGSLVFSYYPDQKWLSRSKFLS